MKVLHVIDDLDHNGAQATLFRLLSAMDRKRFEPIVVSLLKGGTLRRPIEALGVQVYALGMANVRGAPRSMWRLVRIIRDLRPQIIQGWAYYGNLAATVGAALALGSWPVIWNIRHEAHDLKYEKRRTSIAIRLGAFISRSPVRIIYCAWSSAKNHEALGYASSGKIVIPSGIDLSQFITSREARTSVRSEMGIGEDTLVVGLVARFHPMKDHSNFLRAAAILGARRRLDIHFLMAGSGVDTNNASLMRLVGDNGLSTRVHLLGERRDIPRLMAALDIGCCSSWTEASPNVIMEAMACGVPCVSTDVGDVAWVIGQAGRVVPPRDPEALAGAWEAVLTLDTDERRRLGAQARQRIEELFSLPRMVDAYEQLYETVARSNSN